LWVSQLAHEIIHIEGAVETHLGVVRAESVGQIEDRAAASVPKRKKEKRQQKDR
jgi:hypothetical protein